MSDDRFDDTAPNIHDPDLAEFTAAFEGETGADTAVVEAVELDRARLHNLKQLIGRVVFNDCLVLQPLYMEMLVALGDVFLSVADQLLTQQCDVDLFQPTRDEVLRIIGIMSGHVNTMAPKPEVLANVPADGKVN